MSFSSELKNDLCEIKPASPQSALARLCGMLHFARKFTPYEVSLFTENQSVHQLFVKSLEKFGSVPGECILQRKVQKGTGDVYIAEVNEEWSRILNDNYSMYHPAEFLGDYLAGAFLVCGSVTDPNKDYHLEFVIGGKRRCDGFSELLTQASFVPLRTKRQGYEVLYFRDSEQIEDLLTMIGAAKSSLEIMNVKIFKNIRNKVNRITNCETANISKTVAAAASVTQDINYIVDLRGMNYIPEELREVAKVRVENPDMSLRELCTVMEEKISRSGLNHRLRRLSDIACQLRKETGELT